MRILILTTVFALFAAPAAAKTTPDDIRELLVKVAHASNDPGNNADLDRAVGALTQALQALTQSTPEPERAGEVAHGPHGRRGKHGGKTSRDRERCIDLGFAAYNKAFDERYSLERAIEKCQGRIDADLLDMAFAAYNKAFDARYSFEKAVEFGRREELQGKGSLLRLAYQANRKAFDARTSLREAAEWAAAVRLRDEACIRRAYYIHDKQFDSRVALNQAVKTCTR